MPDPISVAGLALELLKWPWRKLMYALGFSNDPLLEIRCDDAVVSASSLPEQDWLHIKVENVGYRRAEDTHPAQGCRVEVEIDTSPHTMLWSPEDDSQPKIARDIQRGFPAMVPLVWRATFGGTMKYGTSFEHNVCHITGQQFLSQQRQDGTLEPGEHEVTVTVHYNPGRRVQNWFVLVVPDPTEGRAMSLHETERKRKHHGKRIGRKGQYA